MNWKLWKIGALVAFFCAVADALGVYVAAESLIWGKVIAFAFIKGMGAAGLFMKQHPAESIRFDSGDKGPLGLWLVGAALIFTTAGCANFDRNVYRTELAVAAGTSAAHKGYAVYWKAATNSPATFNRTIDGLNIERAAVDAATIKVGASLEQVDNLRLSYQTNAAVKPVLQAALLTLSANASNVTWTVSTIIGPQTKE